MRPDVATHHHALRLQERREGAPDQVRGFIGERIAVNPTDIIGFDTVNFHVDSLQIIFGQFGNNKTRFLSYDALCFTLT